ncbi:MAG: alpha/beta fold hydrolase [Candidatus Dormibacteraeota bacterium]|nr:alpha/beta fold hydrolase [Candidatus Dormibacteraeota bacterium]
MRAREPDHHGFSLRDGGRSYWELFGEGERTVFLLPTWSIVQSRFWKSQVAYLARHCRVLTMDARGSGRSDRPTDPEAHGDRALAADALAVMDTSGTERAALVSLSSGARTALLLAAEHPERVEAAVFIGPSAPLAPGNPERMAAMGSFTDPRPVYDGWQKYNANYWRQDLRGFLEFFFGRMLPEPHSTKQIEDCIGWGLETTLEVLIATQLGPGLDEAESLELARRVRCPVLAIHGDADEISPLRRSAVLAEVTGGRLLTLAGSGHSAQARDPVTVNLALADFLLPLPTRQSRRRALTRPRRALFVSSPIGLGHARRDIAIARELRRQVPGLEIDWLAQDPVTRLLAAAGETVHPGSRHLASESRHIETESTSHRLHVFEAWRRMDEILVANFMVFLEAVRATEYDLWIGDEAWEVDYFLHENPELKSAAYVWLTDFVGWLPIPERGERDAFLTADYNAEMLEHVARFPRVRDRAIFIGRPEDIVPDTFGPGLPRIRDWTERHYDFTGGYVLGHEPQHLGDREALRRELGYLPGEVVCVATVGGSGVGHALLARVIEAYPGARRRIPGLRLLAVAGPRLDPGGLPEVAGAEVLTFVPDLDLHLAACDIAVTQGGLTTTMELAAARRPFLYFPLRDHFEQCIHVRHRLERYRAGRCMDFDDATPDRLATALEAALAEPTDYVPVESGTAARAADLISALI